MNIYFSSILKIFSNPTIWDFVSSHPEGPKNFSILADSLAKLVVSNWHRPMDLYNMLEFISTPEAAKQAIRSPSRFMGRMVSMMWAGVPPERLIKDRNLARILLEEPERFDRMMLEAQKRNRKTTRARHK